MTILDLAVIIYDVITIVAYLALYCNTQALFHHCFMKHYGLVVIYYGLSTGKMIYCVVTMRYQMNQVVATVLWKLRDCKANIRPKAKGEKQ
jgi:hypothetical protein